MTRIDRRFGPSAFAFVAMAALAVAEVGPAIAPDDPRPVQAPGAAPEEGEPVHGIVVDEAGKAVAGALVEWPLPPLLVPTIAPVRSGADGRFAIRGLPPGPIGGSVRASADGNDRLGLIAFRRDSLGANDPLRIVLKPSRPLLVRVSDASGARVAGASVEVLSRNAVTPGLTDAEGIARFRLPADLGGGAITAMKDGVGYDSFVTPTPTDGPPRVTPTPPEVALTLGGARTLTIKAVDTAGRPMPGVRVLPSRIKKSAAFSDSDSLTGRTWPATTDAAGIARFRWFPRTGKAVVSASLDRAAHAEERVMVDANTPGDLVATVRLIWNARLDGQVVNADGTPAPGVRIQAQGTGAATGFGYARTDAQGRYSMSVVPNASYMIVVLDRDRAATPITGIVVHEAESRQGLDFRLIGGTRLRGRVAIAPDGSYGEIPPHMVSISIQFSGAELPEEWQSIPSRRLREQSSAFVKVDAEGRYEVRLGPGVYEVRGPGRQPIQVIRVDGTGEVVADFLQPPDPPLVELKGRVVMDRDDGTEVPVAGVTVGVFAPLPGWRDSPKVRTDAEGRFALRRPDMAIALYARNADGTVAGFVQVTREMKEIKVTVNKAGTASGRIVDDAGRPVTEGLVNLTLQRKGGDQGGNIVSARLGPDGRYRAAGLIPGASYRASILVREGPRRGESLPMKEFELKDIIPLDLSDFTVPAKP